MAVLVFERGGLNVKDAKRGELGGPELAFTHRNDLPAKLDADEVRELREELGDWLRRVGRDT